MSDTGRQTTGKKVRIFGRSNDIAALPVGFSKDGKWLAVSVYTRAALRNTDAPATVLLWDVTTGEAKHVIQGNALGWSLSDDGKWLITGREEKTVRIWDVETGKQVRAFAGYKKPVSDCSLSSDKELLATYDQTGTARLWNVATGKELRALAVHPRPDHVLFSRDAKSLVTWSPSRLTLWDLAKAKAVRSMRRKVDE